MTREEAITALRIEANPNNWDIEKTHSEADKILCELLTDLGYADVVAEWEKVEKWYA